MGLMSAWHGQVAQVITCPVLNKQLSTTCLEQAAEHGTSQSGGERATKRLCKVPAGPGIPLNSDWLLSQSTHAMTHYSAYEKRKRESPEHKKKHSRRNFEKRNFGEIFFMKSDERK